MKTILVLIAAMSLASCAHQPSTDELMAEANQCVLEYNENGIIKPAPDEYKDECWVKFNDRSDAEMKREEKRKSATYCADIRMIEFCDKYGCGCAAVQSVQSVIGSRRY